MGEVPYGYKLHNGAVVPDYAVARSVAVDVVLEKMGIFGLKEVDGKNGKEFKGACPFGADHGKQGSFSINKETGAFMCFACKRKGSHVLKFVEEYIAIHSNIESEILGVGTQAAARWLITLVQPKETGQEREPTETKPQADYGREKVGVFMAFFLAPLWKVLQDDENPVALGESIAFEIMELAHTIALEKEGESEET